MICGFTYTFAQLVEDAFAQGAKECPNPLAFLALMYCSLLTGGHAAYNQCPAGMKAL